MRSRRLGCLVSTLACQMKMTFDMGTSIIVSSCKGLMSMTGVSLSKVSKFKSRIGRCVRQPKNLQGVSGRGAGWKPLRTELGQGHWSG